MQRFAKPPGGVTCLEGSNPSLSATDRAPVAQWIERQVADLKAVGSSPAGRASHANGNGPFGIRPGSRSIDARVATMWRTSAGLVPAGRSPATPARARRRCSRGPRPRPSAARCAGRPLRPLPYGRMATGGGRRGGAGGVAGRAEASPIGRRSAPATMPRHKGRRPRRVMSRDSARATQAEWGRIQRESGTLRPSLIRQRHRAGRCRGRTGRPDDRRRQGLLQGQGSLPAAPAADAAPEPRVAVTSRAILVERAQAGDRDAFGALLSRWLAPALR